MLGLEVVGGCTVRQGNREKGGQSKQEGVKVVFVCQLCMYKQT